MVTRYDLYLTLCPYCGHDHLIRWGYYQRQGLPQIKNILIQRVRCTGCGRTTNVLPSFLLAYKYFAVALAKKLLLLLREHPDNWQQALTPIIDMSTAYRWLRRFIRQANTSLPAIRAALLELVPETCPSRHQSLAVRSPPALVTRFISLSQQLFQASVRLVDTKQHQQAKIQQAQQLLGQAPAEPASPPFTAARFFKELATVLKRNVEQFHATELEAMQSARLIPL